MGNNCCDSSEDPLKSLNYTGKPKNTGQKIISRNIDGDPALGNLKGRAKILTRLRMNAR